jgi:hypothetical protein
MQVLGDVQTTYRSFAVYAADNSPCFEEWALGVAEDREVQRWLAQLPEPKRQPNLVFAAARWHGLAAPAPYDDLRVALLGDTGRIRATILERATQTNEVGRLATLLPAFASVPGDGPVGLLEVGASAGLCLFPDRWSYSWTTEHGTVTAGSAAPTLRGRLGSGSTPGRRPRGRMARRHRPESPRRRRPRHLPLAAAAGLARARGPPGAARGGVGHHAP